MNTWKKVTHKFPELQYIKTNIKPHRSLEPRNNPCYYFVEVVRSIEPKTVHPVVTRLYVWGYGNWVCLYVMPLQLELDFAALCKLGQCVVLRYGTLYMQCLSFFPSLQGSPYL